MAYVRGIRRRSESIHKAYSLGLIDFRGGDVFLDCGANVGDLKIWFDLNGVEVDYIGFEPSPQEYACLSENVAPSAAHNVGLWNAPGDLEFYVSSQGADSSLIEPPDYDEKIVVPTRRLDSYITGPIKCLKLEAEGAEPEILEGAGEALKFVEYVAADLGFERGVAAESTLAPVTNYLLARGFELVHVTKSRLCALYRNRNFQGS
ncbi:MAG: FkbM family methyltransferase [Phycisphaerales bacterium]|nr:FkbM family methyltransferase [Phycisphaerales bacterium]